ncbi:HDOD domain-containing protein [Chitinimonas arctica]|uniref:HDOD domain-containing protein n=1 Tax=Chitinimonas arctica TaxID=2594795 RepID=A0A516S9R5_9NEIS|nr:HDOD domain-containing protein [Chitinimonas arctica]QDQ24894.1 HDOD domain-containing protein [Chitinimonas arctica]
MKINTEALDLPSPAEQWLAAYGDKLPRHNPAIVAFIGGGHEHDDELAALERSASGNPSSILRLLKVANSPFFGLSKQITSVKQAITVLGFSAASAIVLRGIILDAFDISSADLMANELIAHSVMTGICAKVLAEEWGEPRDIAFTIGILHNIGKLTMLVYARTLAEEIYRGNERTGEELERELEVFGFSHAELGILMLKKWHIPDTIIEAIRDYPDLADCSTRLKRIIHHAQAIAGLLRQEGGGPLPGNTIERLSNELDVSGPRLHALTHTILREVAIIIAPV